MWRCETTHCSKETKNPGPRYQSAAAKSGQRRDQLEVTTCFALCWLGSSRAGSRPAWPWRWMRLAWATASRSCRSASSTAAMPSPWPGRSCTPMCRTLETGVGRLAPGLRRLGPARLDGDRDDRPHLVCPLVLPGDRVLGLAPRDADHAPKQVPQGPIEEERAGHGAGLGAVG